MINHVQIISEKGMKVNLPLGTLASDDEERIVKRISKDYNIDMNESKKIFEATKDFISLAITYRGNGFVPSVDIDKGWHTFLLYTKLYMKFCESLGLPFLHHEPSDGNHKVEKGGLYRTIKFMKDNNINFDTEIWSENKLMADCRADPCKCTGCKEWD